MKQDTVFEIGTGLGTLTAELARLGKHVVSYEIDRRLWLQAKARLTKFDNVTLINADFKHFNEPFDVIVTSLPFSESSGFTTWLVQRQFKRGVVILQKEFVQKLLAPVGSKMYRSVSVLAQMSLDLEKIGDIPSTAFSPPPKVWAELVRLKPRLPPLSLTQVRLVKSLFSFKGRTLGAFLRHQRIIIPSIDERLLSMRIENIAPSQHFQILLKIYDGL